MCRNPNANFEPSADATLDQVLPPDVASRVRYLNIQIEKLVQDTETRLGIHFKMCNLFCKIYEENPDSLNKEDTAYLQEHLGLFSSLFKLKVLKDSLMLIIRTGKILRLAEVEPAKKKRGIQKQQSMIQLSDDEKEEQSEEEDKEEEAANQNEGLIERKVVFNEPEFLRICQSEGKVVEYSMILSCIEELDNNYPQINSYIKNLTETELLPVYDIMTQQYEDKIDEYLSTSNLSMKELQAFYKVRTKILHGRIRELNKLVGQQNDDIKEAKSMYTDDLATLKEEVSGLRHMASQLEIMQQSADFYMHGAYITNENDFDQSISFERNNKATSSLYQKLKAKTIVQTQRYSVASKQSTSQKGKFVDQRAQNTAKSLVKKRQEQQRFSNTRHNVRSSTDNTNRLQLQNDESRSNSQLSTHNIGIDSYAVYQQQQQVMTSKNLPLRKTFINIDSEFSQTQKLGYTVGDSQLDGIFNQSPIHGTSLAVQGKNANMLGSIEEFMNTAGNSHYNSNRRGEDPTTSVDIDLIQNLNQIDQVNVAEFGVDQQQQFRHTGQKNSNRFLGGLALSDRIPAYDSTQHSAIDTGRYKGDYMITQEDDLVDLLEHRPIEQEVEDLIIDERENYLDESIDKIEENQNESMDNFDIVPNQDDYGESSRSASDKLADIKKSRSNDRMTPEFKLHGEGQVASSIKKISGHIGRSSDDDLGKENLIPSSQSKYDVRQFLIDTDNQEQLTE